MECLSLNKDWLIKGNMPTGEPLEIRADVPCTVHSAMIENKIIDNLYLDKNADNWMWIEEKNRCFENKFQYSKSNDTKCIELEFEGLDTYCNVYLNSTLIGFCDSAHITYTFDVTSIIQDGTNNLKIEFLPHREQIKDIDHNVCGGVFCTDRLFVRRMQCTFGWDWVHRLVTMGIWRNVNLYTVYQPPCKNRMSAGPIKRSYTYGCQYGVYSFYDCNEFKADGTTIYVCDIKTDICSDRSFFLGVKPSDLKFENANVEITKNENKVILKSDKTAFYVMLDGEMKFEDNCILLLPGEEIAIGYEKTIYNVTDEIKLHWINQF